MRASAWFVLTVVAASACSESHTTPTAPAVQPTVLSAALRNVPASAIAERPVQLHVAVVMSNGVEDVVTTGARWTTSNSDIATVDASGLLTGHALGTATITVELKGVSISSPVRVLADMSGTWAIRMPEGQGRWTDLTQAQVSQDGSAVAGRWQWDSGVQIHFSGTVDAEGNVRLTGRDCYTGNTYGYVLYEVRDWLMSFSSSRGVFEGTLTLSESGTYLGGPCSGWILNNQKPRALAFPVSVEVVGTSH